MDWTQFPQWFVTAILGAGIVKLLDEVFHRARKAHDQKESIVVELEQLIDELAELEALYRLFARQGGSITQDEKGHLKKDENDNYVVEKYEFEPEPRFEQAMKSLEGTDINGVIAQKVIG